MTKKEEEFETLTDIQIVSLSNQKVILETKIEDFKQIIEILEPRKKSLEEAVSCLTDIFEKLSKGVGGLEKEIGDSHQLNSQNIKEIGNFLVSIKGEFQKLVDINTENVKRANVVINDLPRIIFDMQKTILERRTLNKHQI